MNQFVSVSNIYIGLRQNQSCMLQKYDVLSEVSRSQIPTGHLPKKRTNPTRTRINKYIDKLMNYLINKICISLVFSSVYISFVYIYFYFRKNNFLRYFVREFEKFYSQSFPQ